MALGIAAAVLAASLAQASPTDCAVDTAAMLKLDPAQFDQDIVGGWRPLAGREAAPMPRRICSPHTAKRIGAH